LVGHPTIPAHEVAAYALSRTAGFHFVPPTVAFDRAGRPGSLQWFVPELNVARKGGVRPDDSRLVLLHVFDYLIRNADRNQGNYGSAGSADAEERGALVAIDHGQATFAPAIRPYASFQGQLHPPTKELSTEHRELIARIQLPLVARALVRSGLEGEKVAGVLGRIVNLQRAYPVQGVGRQDGILSEKDLAYVRALVTKAETRVSGGAGPLRR
jgi:hypothetical protein